MHTVKEYHLNEAAMYGADAYMHPAGARPVDAYKRAFSAHLTATGLYSEFEIEQAATRNATAYDAWRSE